MFLNFALKEKVAVTRIIKILAIGTILCNLSAGQQKNNNNSDQSTKPEITTGQRIRMHDLMNKMRTIRDKDGRLAIIKEMRELRKNPKQEKFEYTKPEAKNEPRPIKENTFKQTGERMAYQSDPAELSQLYRIPFASVNNRIELTVANTSAIIASNLQVEAVNLPEWFRLSPVKQLIKSIPPNGEHQVQFSFSIEKSAPVEKELTINFSIRTSNNERWMKQIKLSVNAPEHFELFQNYPNPFNPSTNFQFTIANSQLTILRVYDALGQEIKTLVNEVRQPGSYIVQWDASGSRGLPSGIYFYKLQAGKFIDTKKMMLVR